MWTWLSQNAAALGVSVNLAMTAIWLAYLQLFLISFRRANRAVIHIGMADERNGDARCILSNMGSDVVYILAVKVDLDCAGETCSAIVTDRVEEIETLGGDFRERTNKGPLGGGEALDIGSFRRIGERAAHNHGAELALEDCDAITVTVVMAAQQAHKLRGGYKRFEIDRNAGGTLHFRSRDVLTRQIKGRQHRRALRRMIVDGS